MSQTDSFVDEVSEELRRDKLFAMIRRYGWIPVLVVLALVAWAGWTEYRAAQERAAADAAGDALIAAIEAETPAERAAALAEVSLEGDAAAIAALLLAAEQQAAGELEAASETLARVEAMDGLPALYTELATLKRLMLGLDAPEDRIEALAPLALPGAPYRLLAAELIAYARLEAGDRDAALADLRAILVDAEVTDGLRQRAENMIVALGEELDLPAGATE